MARRASNNLVAASTLLFLLYSASALQVPLDSQEPIPQPPLSFSSFPSSPFLKPPSRSPSSSANCTCPGPEPLSSFPVPETNITLHQLSTMIYCRTGSLGLDERSPDSTLDESELERCKQYSGGYMGWVLRGEGEEGIAYLAHQNWACRGNQIGEVVRNKTWELCDVWVNRG